MNNGNHRGFLLIEVMLAIAVFLLLVSAFTTAYLYGQESSALAGTRSQAVLLSHEGLEAARNITDAGFDNLTDGTYGLTQSGNTWMLSGSSDTVDIFTRSLTISSVSDERKYVTSTVSWQQNPGRTGAVALTTQFTNWQDTSGSPSCGSQAHILHIDTSDAEIGGGGNKELRDIALENTSASCDITISAITLSWTNTKLIEEIKIDGTRVWKYDAEGSPDGRQPSDTELDIADYTLESDSTDDIDKFEFNGNMAGASFTLTMRMSDGTVTSAPSFMP